MHVVSLTLQEITQDLEIPWLYTYTAIALKRFIRLVKEFNILTWLQPSYGILVSACEVARQVMPAHIHQVYKIQRWPYSLHQHK